VNPKNRIEPYFVSVRVLFGKVIKCLDEDGTGTSMPPLTGYFCNFGLNAKNLSEAKIMVEHSVDDGNVDWAGSVWKRFEAVDQDIALRRVAVNGAKIWYKSGKILF
jgi:hypothetical protein